MAFLVHFKTGILDETLPTKVAFVWLLLGVNKHVQFEVAATRKPTSTFFALEFSNVQMHDADMPSS